MEKYNFGYFSNGLGGEMKGRRNGSARMQQNKILVILIIDSAYGD